jgi:hypothetical protein
VRFLLDSCCRCTACDCKKRFRKVSFRAGFARFHEFLTPPKPPFCFTKGVRQGISPVCRNAPKGDTVTFGFNVPQTGAYADEGADELRAYELAVEHINAGGGGMLDTFSSKALTGGVNGKKVLRHRRHADQVRRRPRIGQAHDRE